MTGVSIDVDQVIYDDFMHSVKTPTMEIHYPLLITSLSGRVRIMWFSNKELGFTMRAIDKGVIE